MSWLFIHLLFCLLWAALLGAFDFLTLLSGFAIGLLLFRMTLNKASRRYRQHLFGALRFSIFYLREILTSNCKIALDVLRGRPRIQPGIGLLRFPDFYTRCHAGTKAASLGAGLILIGALAPIDDPDITIRVWLTILFIFLAIPVAGHLLGRAAFLRDNKKWPKDNFEAWNKKNRDLK